MSQDANTMTRPEAMRTMRAAAPRDCDIRGLERTYDDCDDVTTWAADLWCTETSQGKVAEINFDEHYPEPTITWI